MPKRPLSSPTVSFNVPNFPRSFDTIINVFAAKHRLTKPEALTYILIRGLNDIDSLKSEDVEALKSQILDK